MNAIVFGFLVLSAGLATGCGSDSPAPGGPAGGGSGTIGGTLMGIGFTSVASAWWIGTPGAGSLPTQVYVTDAAVDCAAISIGAWDKVLGNNKQMLELYMTGPAPKVYTIGTEADAAWVSPGGQFNPSSEAGTITITASEESKSMSGSFDLKFAGESLKGTFDALFCETGVEP